MLKELQSCVLVFKNFITSSLCERRFNPLCRSKILNLQKNGNIHRSQSVPDLIKGTQSDSLGGVFRVIPATPHVEGETGAASISNQPLDAGNFCF